MHKKKNKIVQQESTNYITERRARMNLKIIVDILKLFKTASPFLFTQQSEYNTLWHASAFSENTLVPELKKHIKGFFSPLFSNFLLFIPLLVTENRVFDILMQIYVSEIKCVAAKIKVSPPHSPPKTLVQSSDPSQKQETQDENVVNLLHKKYNIHTDFTKDSHTVTSRALLWNPVLKRWFIHTLDAKVWSHPFFCNILQKHDQECIICFDKLKLIRAPLTTCESCTQTFCLDHVKYLNQKCPACRTCLF